MPDETQLSIVRCAACGEFLPKGNANKRFHNSSCRARFWRRVRDITVHAELIQVYLADMQSVIEAGFEVLTIERQLNDIEATLADCRAALSKIRNEKANEYGIR